MIANGGEEILLHVGIR